MTPSRPVPSRTKLAGSGVTALLSAKENLTALVLVSGKAVERLMPVELLLSSENVTGITCS